MGGMVQLVGGDQPPQTADRYLTGGTCAARRLVLSFPCTYARNEEESERAGNAFEPGISQSRYPAAGQCSRNRFRLDDCCFPCRSPLAENWLHPRRRPSARASTVCRRSEERRVGKECR